MQRRSRLTILRCSKFEDVVGYIARIVPNGTGDDNNPQDNCIFSFLHCQIVTRTYCGEAINEIEERTIVPLSEDNNRVGQILSRLCRPDGYSVLGKDKQWTDAGLNCNGNVNSPVSLLDLKETSTKSRHLGLQLTYQPEGRPIDLVENCVKSTWTC